MPEIVQQQPDIDSALYALDAASELLNAAAEKLSQKDYTTAFSTSRDCMRIAISALLFRDGVIAPTFEATEEYLERHYPDKLPLKDWHSIENTCTGEGSGLFNMIIRATRKPTDKNEAKHAVGIAKEFVKNIMELVML